MSHTSTMPELIRELYRVFKPYRLGDDFTGCDHCVAEGASRRLAKFALQELTVPDVNHYAFKALTTWGGERHFKHFLPRLLELASTDYLQFDFPEVLLGKLAYVRWSTWPAAERTAVHRFLHGFWLQQLATDGDFSKDDRIRIVLGGLAAACSSLAEYLVLWEPSLGVNAALHGAQLIDSSADELLTKGTLARWGTPTVASGELLAWICSGHSRRLLNAFAESVTNMFPLVFDQLDGIRAAMSTKSGM